MFRTMFASLRSHRARLAMTALAVALGTGLMCGSFVFTATLTHSLDALFAQSAVGTDVEVRHVSPPGAALKRNRLIACAGQTSLSSSSARSVSSVSSKRKCCADREKACSWTTWPFAFSVARA